MELLATKLKTYTAAKKKFVKDTDAHSWENAKKRFPEYATEKQMAPFLPLFKKKNSNMDAFDSFVKGALEVEEIAKKGKRNVHGRAIQVFIFSSSIFIIPKFFSSILIHSIYFSVLVLIYIECRNWKLRPC